MQDYSPFTFNSCMRKLSSLITVDVSFAIDIRNHFAVRDNLIAHMKMCTGGYPWQFTLAQITALNLVLKSSNMRQIQKSTFSVKLTRIPFVFYTTVLLGEHSTAYLTSRSYSIQLCNYYTIIYTMLLLRSLTDNYKKITIPSIVVLMV